MMVEQSTHILNTERVKRCNIWMYYDFQTNWEIFYELWSTEEVQDILEKDMYIWCDREADFVRKNGRLVKPTWVRGDDLWNYSKTDFHDTRITARIKKHIEAKEEFLCEVYGDCEEEDFSIACIQLYDQFEPQKGSLEAQIMIQGANYLVNTLYYIADKLFPNHCVQIISDSQECIVVVPELGILFDFIRCFLSEEHFKFSDLENFHVAKSNRKNS
ncbi:hypothetical protein AKO1_006067 [Acrasis kona]|uniref:Uncharacterized protein n=1 Tax=Acrasis kona TaxID=1008807 RepID=A0AAW2YIT0_9EUKA